MVRRLKNMLFCLLLVGVGFGAATVMEITPLRSAFGQPVVVDDHWRYHEGRWSYWSAVDKLWYYTDGVHWFYHDGRAWAPYRFDHTFGRKFERGAYEHPGHGVKVPVHGIYVR